MVSLVANPDCHARTKHVELDLHFIRERVLSKLLTTNHIPFIEKIADIFSNALFICQFLLNKHKLNVINMPLSLKGDVEDTISASILTNTTVQDATNASVQIASDSN